jgi:hypothetical protein
MKINFSVRNIQTDFVKPVPQHPARDLNDILPLKTESTVLTKLDLPEEIRPIKRKLTCGIVSGGTSVRFIGV